MRCTTILLQQFETNSIGLENNSRRIVDHRLNNDSAQLAIGSVLEEQFQYLLVSHVLLSLFLILSNSLVIAGLIKTSNEIKIPQKLFIMSSICGLLIGMIIPSFFFAYLFAPDDSCLVENILEMIYGMVLICEAEFMVTLSITRLISVKWPFFEIEWKTIKIIIIAEMTFALCIPVVFSFLSEDELLAWIIQVVISLLLIFLILILGFASVYCLLTRPNSGLRANAASRLDYNRIWKPIIRIATIQTTYVLCHLPMTVFSVILILTAPAGYQSISSEEIVRNEIITIWLYMLIEFYNGLNACLYITQCKEIRLYYFGFLRRRVRAVRSPLQICQFYPVGMQHSLISHS